MSLDDVVVFVLFWGCVLATAAGLVLINYSIAWLLAWVLGSLVLVWPIAVVLLALEVLAFGWAYRRM